MSAPSNGITAEVIREFMPPYQLSDDLLGATFAALAPPPRDASTAWRHARIRRLTQEISTLMPANAAQARLAADILMVREMARSIGARVNEPDLTVPEMGRVGRVAGELLRTAGVLLRTLERGQQKPAPFFGTVLADAVDVVALDAAWCNESPGLLGERPMQQPATPGAAAEVDPVGLEAGAEAKDVAGAEEVLSGGTAVAGTAVTGGETIDLDPMDQSAMQQSAMQQSAMQQSGAETGLGVGSTPEGVVTRLGQGPGWVLDVVRPRVSAQATVGVAPAAT